MATAKIDALTKLVGELKTEVSDLQVTISEQSTAYNAQIVEISQKLDNLNTLLEAKGNVKTATKRSVKKADGGTTTTKPKAKVANKPASNSMQFFKLDVYSKDPEGTIKKYAFTEEQVNEIREKDSIKNRKNDDDRLKAEAAEFWRLLSTETKTAIKTDFTNHKEALKKKEEDAKPELIDEVNSDND